MYTKPTGIANVLSDYEAMLEQTKNDPSMVAYYAFYGVKAKVGEALLYLTQLAKDDACTEAQRAAIPVLQRLDGIKREE